MRTFIHDQLKAFELIHARLHHLPPVGYLIDTANWKFLVDPVLGPLIEKVWELSANGTAVDEVLRIINEEHGFRTPKHGKLGGKPLHRKTLYDLLKDPFYAGYVCLGESLCKGLHEPLVSEEAFFKVQDLFRQRRRNWSKV